MAYSTGEAAILTLIRTLADYDADNTSRADWRILGQGASNKYIVLRPGAWEGSQLAITTRARTWSTVVECWLRYVDNTKPLSLQTEVETVMALLERYPTLNGASGVVRATVTGGDDMQEVKREDGSLWAKWSFTVQWIEEKAVTYA